MGIENGFSGLNNSEEPKAEKKNHTIRVTSPEDYVSMIQEHPIVETDSDGRLIDFVRQNHLIEAKVTADRYIKRYSKYFENGLLEEEVGYFPDNPMESGQSLEFAKAWRDNVVAGYHVEVVPVFDADNKYIGDKIFRTRQETIKKNAEAKLKIDEEWQDEDIHSWFYEEQEKEKQYQEKVRNGEMVYLGEISFDEWVKLREGIFERVEMEPIWLFDENKNPIRDKQKYYARTK